MRPRTHNSFCSQPTPSPTSCTAWEEMHANCFVADVSFFHARPSQPISLYRLHKNCHEREVESHSSASDSGCALSAFLIAHALLYTCCALGEAFSQRWIREEPAGRILHRDRQAGRHSEQLKEGKNLCMCVHHNMRILQFQVCSYTMFFWAPKEKCDAISNSYCTFSTPKSCLETSSLSEHLSATVNMFCFCFCFGSERKCSQMFTACKLTCHIRVLTVKLTQTRTCLSLFLPLALSSSVCKIFCVPQIWTDWPQKVLILFWDWKSSGNPISRGSLKCVCVCEWVF